jgi:hypothetical protein
MIRLSKTLLAGVVLASLAIPAFAQDMKSDGDSRLLIVNGNTGHVIYDDGHDDLFCVTRKRFAGYNDYGYPVHRRTMHCR